MDNQAYLNQIAVKGKSKDNGPLLPPLVIKLLCAGVIAIITLFIAGSVISSSNQKITAQYEEIYLLATRLTDNQSPFKKYSKELKSNDLVTYNTSITNSLSSLSKNIGAMTSELKYDTGNISKDVKSKVDAKVSNISIALEQGHYNGDIDNAYANEALYVVNYLINIETGTRNKTPSNTLITHLDNSLSDLKIIQENLEAYTQTH